MPSVKGDGEEAERDARDCHGGRARVRPYGCPDPLQDRARSLRACGI